MSLALAFDNLQSNMMRSFKLGWFRVKKRITKYKIRSTRIHNQMVKKRGLRETAQNYKY